MDFKIRQYKPQDASQLKILLEELVKSEAKKNFLRLPFPKPEYKEVYFQGLIKKINENSTQIYVAEDAGLIIGYVAGTIQFVSGDDLLEFKPVKEGFITDIFVKEKYRKNEIGKKLMKMIMQYFEKQKCDILKLFTQSENDIAHHLYLQCGFSDYNQKMIKVINPDLYK